jgi:uncharacterized protein YycO
VDFVLEDGSLLGSRLDGGVQIRPKGYADFSLVITTRIEADYNRIINRALSQIGKPYDCGAIINLVRQRNWREEGKWFCSEFAAWAFEMENFPLLNPKMQAWRISPRDLLLSPFLIYDEALLSAVHV